MQHLVDRQFLIWEKLNQPRRALARLTVCSSHAACAMQLVKVNHTTQQDRDDGFDVVGTLI